MKRISMAREVGRAVRHNADCKMNHIDLQNTFIALIDLLSDPTSLGQDGQAKHAVRTLKQLEVDTLKITEAEMSNLLKDAQDTLTQMKQVADASLKEMNDFLENFLKRYASIKEEDYVCASEEFITRLKKHYNDALSHVSMSTLFPSGDESLHKLYAAPSICRKTENNDGENEAVSTYNEILYTGEKLKKRIFLQDEAGMGKTTFATKLILDWCNQVEASSLLPESNPPFYDASTIHEFKLALFITLRDSVVHRDVTKMIKEQLIDLMYADTDREEAYLLLNKLMQTERCLVVHDGLDEWRDPEGKVAQPI
ncbi:uncharacterized protein LOC127871643 isoform X2 [Dreissena polymorpha]|uniref:uncharacterized protein LOC127871643 isoform X2 n=1 Tax=Dreissena polymorpha TaxID=45954 RepID=UPI00226478A4|nr:uncharacterized protein LOC127871643 isoform X2 [Dreissena polymorpha]